MELKTLQDAIAAWAKERAPYYQQWLFDEPFIVPARVDAEFVRLQGLMERLVTRFVTEYPRYRHLMPVSPRIEQVLEMYRDVPYRPGTYRTDFVFDPEGQARMIEITCRMGLNGIFLSTIMARLTRDFHAKHASDTAFVDRDSPLHAHLYSYLEGTDRVVVATGADKRNESKIFVPILERMGIDVECVPYQEIPNRIASWKNPLIIYELSFDELLRLPDDVLARLIRMRSINDLRTIFLIHDKRFFSTLCQEELLQDVLETEERAFFQRFLVPTYTATERLDLWQDARQNKDAWIIKHRILGKSQEVYAGQVTPQEEWETLLDGPSRENLVLQQWIEQRLISGSVGGVEYEDYIVGTLLFFDNHYFGMGDFRTSSHPVTNKTDHRKMSSLILEGDEDELRARFRNVMR